MSEDTQKLDNEETMDVNTNIPTSSKTLAEKEKTHVEHAMAFSPEHENKSDLQLAIELSMQPFLPQKETDLELATKPSTSQTSSYENQREQKSIAIMSELQNTIHVIAEELQTVLNQEEIPEPQAELGYESTLSEWSLATYEPDLKDDNEPSISLNQASKRKFVVDSNTVAVAIQKAMRADLTQKSVKKETASKIDKNPMLNELLSSPIKERHPLPETRTPNDLPRQTVIVSGGDLNKCKKYMSREEKECLSRFEEKYETLEKGISLLHDLESYDFNYVDSNAELSEEADEVQERELERFMIDHITGVFSERFDFVPPSENYISDRRKIAWTNFFEDKENSSNLSTKRSKTDERDSTTQAAEAMFQTSATKAKHPLEPSCAPEMKFIITPQEQSMLHNYFNFTETAMQERHDTISNAIRQSREKIKLNEETIDILSSNRASLVSQDEKEFESSKPSTSFNKEIIESSQISNLKEKIQQERDFNPSIENEAEINDEIAHEDIPSSTEYTNFNLENARRRKKTMKTPKFSDFLLFDNLLKVKDELENSAGVRFSNFENKNEQNIADTSISHTVPVMRQSNEYKEFIAPESFYNETLRDLDAEKLFRSSIKEDKSDKEDDEDDDDEDPESDNHEKHDSEPDGDGPGKDGKGQGRAGDGHGKDGRGQGHAGDGHGKGGRGQRHAGDGRGKGSRGQRHAGDGRGKDGRGQGHAGEGNKKDSKVNRHASDCNERDGKGQRTACNSNGKNGNLHNKTNNERDEINLRNINDNENGHYNDCYHNDSNHNGPNNKLKLFKNKLDVLTDVNCVSNFNCLKVFSKNFLSGDCLKCRLPKINICNNQYADKNTDIFEQNMLNCYALNLNDSYQIFSTNKQNESTTCKQNTVFENVSRKTKLNKIGSNLNIKNLKYDYKSKTVLNTLKLPLETSLAFATTFFIITSVIIFIIWTKLRQLLSC